MAIEEVLVRVREEQGEATEMRAYKWKRSDQVVTIDLTKREVVLLPCTLSIQKLADV